MRSDRTSNDVYNHAQNFPFRAPRLEFRLDQNFRSAVCECRRKYSSEIAVAATEWLSRRNHFERFVELISLLSFLPVATLKYVRRHRRLLATEQTLYIYHYTLPRGSATVAPRSVIYLRMYSNDYDIYNHRSCYLRSKLECSVESPSRRQPALCTSLREFSRPECCRWCL